MELQKGVDHGELVVELVVGKLVDDLVEELVGELIVGDVVVVEGVDHGKIVDDLVEELVGELVVGDVEVVVQLGLEVVEGYLLAKLCLKCGDGL